MSNHGTSAAAAIAQYSVIRSSANQREHQIYIETQLRKKTCQPGDLAKAAAASGVPGTGTINTNGSAGA